jgi:hypothetical protein
MKLRALLDKADFLDAERISALHGTSLPVAAMQRSLLKPNESLEYLAIAKSIGLDDDLGYILDIKLRDVLAEENIRVYDYDQVAIFLDTKLQEEWKWMPLRQIDAEEFPGGNWGHTIANKRRVFSNERYNRPVPLPVLLTVEKIVKRIPEVRFFVSGIKRDADPFLCATTKLLHTYVIERWDEPDYRER